MSSFLKSIRSLRKWLETDPTEQELASAHEEELSEAKRSTAISLLEAALERHGKTRARNEDGQFKPDDPDTPEDEAWEDPSLDLEPEVVLQPPASASPGSVSWSWDGDNLNLDFLNAEDKAKYISVTLSESNGETARWACHKPSGTATLTFPPLPWKWRRGGSAPAPQSAKPTATSAPARVSTQHLGPRGNRTDDERSR